MDLPQARRLVESAPAPRGQAVSQQDAEAIVQSLSGAGARPIVSA